MTRVPFAVVREAGEVLLRHLELLPLSDTTEQLQVWVRGCMQEAERWSASPPPARERDLLMQRLLMLQVAVARLEREGRTPQSLPSPMLSYPVG
jgi:hypothetical protein